MARDYAKEYRDYHSKPSQVKRRAKRNAARRLLVKEGRVKKGDGKDVDHKDRNPSNNAPSNLRVTSKKANRSRNQSFQSIMNTQPRQIPNGIIELKSGSEYKIKSLLKQDDELIGEGGLEKRVKKSAVLGIPMATAIGALYGAAANKGKTVLKEAGKLPAGSYGGGLGKYLGVGALVGGGAGSLSLVAERHSLKKRLEGLRRYPRSKGEFGEPGYTGSYMPQHSALPIMVEYFKRPIKMSAREELDMIALGRLEEEDTAIDKAGRIAKSAAVGGVAGRLLAWHPSVNTKLNRATAIGATLGAIGQAGAEHIAAAKVGIRGNPIDVKDESRKSMRELGGAIPGLAAAGGAFRAMGRIKEEEMKDMMQGLRMKYRGTVSEEDAIRQNVKHRRAMGMEGETFIPKMPKFGKRAAAAMGGRPVNIDESGGSVEDKLRRLADRAKGTPEGEAARRKLESLRARSGKTFSGRAKKAVYSALGKLGALFRSKTGKVAAAPAALLMSARESLNEIKFGGAWTRKEGKSRSGGLNEKGRKSYERENPGSDLKAPSKEAGNPRRASFCARMKGMKKKLTSSKTASDPDSRINKSLRAWNCSAREALDEIRFGRTDAAVTKWLNPSYSHQQKIMRGAGMQFLPFGIERNSVQAREVAKLLRERRGHSRVFVKTKGMSPSGYDLNRNYDQLEKALHPSLFSAREALDSIIAFADPRPRNSLGMFSGADGSEIDPEAIGTVYKQGVQPPMQPQDQEQDQEPGQEESALAGVARKLKGKKIRMSARESLDEIRFARGERAIRQIWPVTEHEKMAMFNKVPVFAKSRKMLADRLRAELPDLRKAMAYQKDELRATGYTGKFNWSAREALDGIIRLNSITYHETEADQYRRKSRGHREKSDASLGMLGYATTAAAAAMHPAVASRGAEYVKKAGNAIVGSSVNEGRIRGAVSKVGRYARENPAKVFRGAAFAPAALLGAGYAMHKVGAWRNDSKANEEYGKANDLRRQRNSMMQALLADRIRRPVQMSARESLDGIINFARGEMMLRGTGIPFPSRQELMNPAFDIDIAIAQRGSPEAKEMASALRQRASMERAARASKRTNWLSKMMRAIPPMRMSARESIDSILFDIRECKTGTELSARGELNTIINFAKGDFLMRTIKKVGVSAPRAELDAIEAAGRGVQGAFNQAATGAGRSDLAGANTIGKVRSHLAGQLNEARKATRNAPFKKPVAERPIAPNSGTAPDPRLKTAASYGNTPVGQTGSSVQPVNPAPYQQPVAKQPVAQEAVAQQAAQKQAEEMAGGAVKQPTAMSGPNLKYRLRGWRGASLAGAAGLGAGYALGGGSSNV